MQPAVAAPVQPVVPAAPARIVPRQVVPQPVRVQPSVIVSPAAPVIPAQPAAAVARPLVRQPAVPVTAQPVALVQQPAAVQPAVAKTVVVEESAVRPAIVLDNRRYTVTREDQVPDGTKQYKIPSADPQDEKKVAEAVRFVMPGIGQRLEFDVQLSDKTLPNEGKMVDPIKVWLKEGKKPGRYGVKHHAASVKTSFEIPGGSQRYVFWPNEDGATDDQMDGVQQLEEAEVIVKMKGEDVVVFFANSGKRELTITPRVVQA